MRNTFTFAGTSSDAFGVYISGSGVFNAPVRSYDEITIPNRSGLLLGMEKSLQNLELTYPAFVYTNLKTNAANLKNHLLSRIGYQTLTDTYYPEEFRKAVYKGGLEFEPEQTLNGANFDITFSCKPQRYLVSGETVITITTNTDLTNPTGFPSQPLLRVYGSGVLTVNGTEITIDTDGAYIDIDCELMEAYLGSVLKNNEISLEGNDFPVLDSGNNSIILGSGITQVQVTPRWWRL